VWLALSVRGKTTVLIADAEKFQDRRDEMPALTALWMPIVLSAIFVFIASSIMHMFLPYHRGDYRALPDEQKTLEALRSMGLTKGLYVFPYSSHKEMKSPTMVEKYKLGPVGMMTVLASEPPPMPKFLGLWFVFCLLMGIFVAYVTAHTVPVGAEYLAVFRVAGTVAFMGYGLGKLSDAIWRGQTWSMTIKEVIDGLVYGLLTAGTFGWLWPR
jgi:hypothetical protein